MVLRSTRAILSGVSGWRARLLGLQQQFQPSLPRSQSYTTVNCFGSVCQRLPIVIDLEVAAKRIFDAVD